jgi:hypothetical protein
MNNFTGLGRLLLQKSERIEIFINPQPAAK